MNYSNGDFCDGQFVNDQRHGPATCKYGTTNTNIVVFTTRFENDDIAKRMYSLVYRPCFFEVLTLLTLII